MNLTNSTPSTDPLIVEHTFNSPIAHVWQAITNREAMAIWYFELESFEAVPGFEFRFDVEHEGCHYSHRCRVTEVIPGRKLAYTWRYEGYEGESLVTFELFAEGDQTRLKLTHTGLETFPPLAGFARKNFEKGWTSLVGSSLLEYLENSASLPEAAVERKLVISRIFQAPRELVWRAWTDPAHFQHWFKPDEKMVLRLVKADVRVDGRYRIQMLNPAGEFFTVAGVYREVQMPARLAFTWAFEKDGSEDDFGEVEPSETLVTLEFHARGEQTELVLTHEHFVSDESRDNHQHGWNGCLEQLAEYLAPAGKS